MAIGLNIQGEPGAISAALVRDSFDDLLAILNDASRAAGVREPNWTIAELRIGSAIMSVGGIDEAPILALLREGFARLQEVPQIPSGWSRRMVQRLADLGSRVGQGGATRIDLTGLGMGAQLTPIIVDHATRALGVATISYASFQGRVDRWNEHNQRREIGIALAGGAGAIVVNYNPDLADRIMSEAVGHRVEAWGLVSRDPAGNPISLALEDFEVLPEPRSAPIADLPGLYVVDGEPMVDLNSWLEARGE